MGDSIFFAVLTRLSVVSLFLSSYSAISSCRLTAVIKPKAMLLYHQNCSMIWARISCRNAITPSSCSSRSFRAIFFGSIKIRGPLKVCVNFIHLLAIFSHNLSSTNNYFSLDRKKIILASRGKAKLFNLILQRSHYGMVISCLQLQRRAFN